jgi:hypothetical protein
MAKTQRRFTKEGDGFFRPGGKSIRFELIDAAKDVNVGAKPGQWVGVKAGHLADTGAT